MKQRTLLLFLAVAATCFWLGAMAQTHLNIRWGLSGHGSAIGYNASVRRFVAPIGGQYEDVHLGLREDGVVVWRRAK